jgi:L-threonylcarbamoyladenylate synthase
LIADISAALKALVAGGVIAYPTEAVYGLGCDPESTVALQRILDIKSREAHKGFILVAANQEQLTPFLAPIEPNWQAQLDAAWPGPVTFVLPAASTVSPLLSGQRDTLAVRVSAHPLVKELCTAYGRAIVSTSANVSGHPALSTGQNVERVFNGSIDVIIDGRVGQLLSPTQIIDARTGQRLR